MLPPGLPLRGSPMQAHTRGPAHRLWLALPGACPDPNSGQAHPLTPRVPSARLQTADTGPWVNEPRGQTYSLVTQGSHTGVLGLGHQLP